MKITNKSYPQIKSSPNLEFLNLNDTGQGLCSTLLFVVTHPYQLQSESSIYSTCLKSIRYLDFQLLKFLFLKNMPGSKLHVWLHIVDSAFAIIFIRTSNRFIKLNISKSSPFPPKIVSFSSVLPFRGTSWHLLQNLSFILVLCYISYNLHSVVYKVLLALPSKSLWTINHLLPHTIFYFSTVSSPPNH